MNLPELFIFDMDGLLFDTERLFMELRATVLPKYGYVHREEDYLQTVGVSGTVLFEILDRIYGKNYPKVEVTEDTRVLQMEYIEKNGVPVKPGIKELLDWIREKEIPCCVASSSQTPYVEKFLEAAGLRSYFAYIVGGESVRRTKPDPEIFLKACALNKTEPSKALVFEDSENGVRAAINGGIPVICIPDMVQPSAEIAEKAAVVLSSAADVIPWLTR